MALLQEPFLGGRSRLQYCDRDRMEIKSTASGVAFRVRVTPRASRDVVDGEFQGALKVRLTAPPVDDRANDALRRFSRQPSGRGSIGNHDRVGWKKPDETRVGRRHHASPGRLAGTGRGLMNGSFRSIDHACSETLRIPSVNLNPVGIVPEGPDSRTSKVDRDIVPAGAVDVGGNDLIRLRSVQLLPAAPVVIRPDSEPREVHDQLVSAIAV